MSRGSSASLGKSEPELGIKNQCLFGKSVIYQTGCVSVERQQDSCGLAVPVAARCCSGRQKLLLSPDETTERFPWK